MRILSTRVAHGMSWPIPSQLPDMMDSWDEAVRLRFRAMFEERRQEVLGRLRSSGLWEEVSPRERLFFEAQLLERTQQEVLDASWAMESLACCLWALGVVAKLPGFDTECDTALRDLVPAWEDSKELHLRPQAEIERARSVAELWHWRSRTRWLIEEGRPVKGLPDGLTLDSIARMAAARAAEVGDIPTPCDGDFPAFGKPYRDLSAEEYSAATSIAMERHRALNWICGYAPGNRWDETPTGT